MGQWLRFHTYTAGDTGSIPGSGTKIPNATGPPKKKKTREKGGISFGKPPQIPQVPPKEAPVTFPFLLWATAPLRI